MKPVSSPSTVSDTQYVHAVTVHSRRDAAVLVSLGTSGEISRCHYRTWKPQHPRSLRVVKHTSQLQSPVVETERAVAEGSHIRTETPPRAWAALQAASTLLSATALQSQASLLPPLVYPLCLGPATVLWLIENVPIVKIPFNPFLFLSNKPPLSINKKEQFLPKFSSKNGLSYLKSL